MNHHKWADAAKFLGCHSIRVNAASSGSRSAFGISMPMAALPGMGAIMRAPWLALAIFAAGAGVVLVVLWLAALAPW